jgi:ABC-type antimicrobial peptide transport system permease subunit
LKQFTLPVSVIIVALIAAMIVGVLSALRPARRAARINVLEAISTT